VSIVSAKLLPHQPLRFAALIGPFSFAKLCSYLLFSLLLLRFYLLFPLFFLRFYLLFLLHAFAFRLLLFFAITCLARAFRDVFWGSSRSLRFCCSSFPGSLPIDSLIPVFLPSLGLVSLGFVLPWLVLTSHAFSPSLKERIRSNVSGLKGVPPGVAAWVKARLELWEAAAESDRVRLGLGSANRFKTRTNVLHKKPRAPTVLCVSSKLGSVKGQQKNGLEGTLGFLS
jgi:hypothetical protein